MEMFSNESKNVATGLKIPGNDDDDDSHTNKLVDVVKSAKLLATAITTEMIRALVSWAILLRTCGISASAPKLIT